MNLNEKLETLIQILKEEDIQLAVAESLTGGKLSASIVNISGASQVYKGSVTAYSPEIKIEILNVDPEIIQTQGTVCHEVAKQMARGVKTLLKSDLSISTTGVAGPGPHEGKEAGTVYVGISFMNKETSFFYKTNGNRQEIRDKTVEFCIDKTLELLSKLKK